MRLGVGFRCEGGHAFHRRVLDGVRADHCCGRFTAAPDARCGKHPDARRRLLQAIAQ